MAKKKYKQNIMAKKKEEKENQDELHIYDFVIRTNVNRSKQDTLIHKYEGSGLKSLEEWEELTGTKALEIFK